jgi:hypothetical protein
MLNEGMSNQARSFLTDIKNALISITTKDEILGKFF